MNDLIQNINNLHTTELGVVRIKKNLKIEVNDVVEYLKEKVLNTNAKIYKNGKNLYCEIDGIIITINSYNYSIITAHIKKEG